MARTRPKKTSRKSQKIRSPQYFQSHRSIHSSQLIQSCPNLRTIRLRLSSLLNQKSLCFQLILFHQTRLMIR